ncbi:hypothetical protein L1887_62093 [Cichorium endivia]|nr:hypothetical protein L1887_62093 [Cichorium endivia]
MSEPTKVVHARLDVEAVEPERKDARLALALGVKVLNLDGRRLVQRLETRPGVEEMRDEGEVELGVARDHGAGREVLAAADGVGALEHHLGTLHDVGLLQGCAVAQLRLELAEQHRVVFAVRDVLAEVGDATVPVGRLEVVVDPTKKDLVGGQTEELVERLAVVEEAVELGVILEVDLAEEAAADDLPYEAEDEVLLAVDDVLRADVDDGASDGLGGGDDDVVVLGHLECVGRLAGLAKVEDALVDRVWDRVVDELAEDEAVAALVEELEGVGGDGEACADVGVAGEVGVDVAGEFGAFVLVDGVLGGGGGALDEDLALGDDACGCVAACADLCEQIDVVVELDAARGIEVDLFERFAHLVVGGVALVLDGLDDVLFWDAALFLYVERAETRDETHHLLLRAVVQRRTAETSGGGSELSRGGGGVIDNTYN